MTYHMKHFYLIVALFFLFGCSNKISKDDINEIHSTAGYQNICKILTITLEKEREYGFVANLEYNGQQIYDIDMAIAAIVKSEKLDVYEASLHYIDAIIQQAGSTTNGDANKLEMIKKPLLWAKKKINNIKLHAEDRSVVMVEPTKENAILQSQERVDFYTKEFFIAAPYMQLEFADFSRWNEKFNTDFNKEYHFDYTDILSQDSDKKNFAWNEMHNIFSNSDIGTSQNILYKLYSTIIATYRDRIDVTEQKIAQKNQYLALLKYSNPDMAPFEQKEINDLDRARFEMIDNINKIEKESDLVKNYQAPAKFALLDKPWE